jgi:GT2 family glycosyltransferase
VRSLAAWQKLMPHVYVVDNESTPQSFTVLTQQLPPDSLISSTRNLGYGGGNNLGIRRALGARHQHILLLNSDADITESAVVRLLERLRANPQILVLGPRILEIRARETQLFVGGRNIVRHSSTWIPARLECLNKLPGYPLHEVDYVPGTVFLARAELFAEIGLLDETYFFSGEAADFCKRVKDRGGRNFVDLEVEARHDPFQQPSRMRETLYVYYTLRNRFLYIRKHHRSAQTVDFTFWTGLGALALLRALVSGKLHKARAIGSALRDAYGGRYGDQNALFLKRAGFRAPTDPGA